MIAYALLSDGVIKNKYSAQKGSPIPKRRGGYYPLRKKKGQALICVLSQTDNTHIRACPLCDFVFFDPCQTLISGSSISDPESDSDPEPLSDSLSVPNPESLSEPLPEPLPVPDSEHDGASEAEEVPRSPAPPSGALIPSPPQATRQSTRRERTSKVAKSCFITSPIWERSPRGVAAPVFCPSNNQPTISRGG